MEQLLEFKDLGLAIIIATITYIGIQKLLVRQSKGKSDKKLIHQIILASIFLVGSIAIILSIPMSPGLKAHVTNLLGIVISAVLALSSSTFIGNALAGILLKFVGSFKPGDFIKVGDHFGKISEQGLFHTEIQTINSNLMTLPNLYITTNAVEVFRSSGTIISAEVSLGYDVSRIKIEKCLLQAAKETGLENAFMYIMELGDHSVLYRINGLLQNPSTILYSKSKLHAMILDQLHNYGIEIVSPTFMNQRQIGNQVFIPKKDHISSTNVSNDNPEAIIFTKADKAESIEKRKETKSELDEKITILETELKACKDKEQKIVLKTRIDNLKKGLSNLEQKIESSIEQFEKKDK